MAVVPFLKSLFGHRHKSLATSKKNSAANTTTPSTPQVTVTTCEPAELSYFTCQKLFLKHLFYDGNKDELSVPQKLVIDVVLDSFKKKENRINAIPRLPTVIPKLLRSLRDSKSSVKDYVTIVIKDPVLSAAVLKLANSSYFNPVGARISDIDKAIVKLGIEGLRSVLSAAVMQPIIQRESPYYSQTGQRLWLHSLNTAVACEIMASERNQDKFKLYLAGLVHDIGKITLFSELCKQFKLNGEETIPGFRAFAPAVAKHAKQLSYAIAKDWELPEDICNALRDQVLLKPGKQTSPMALLLFEANIACEAYAISSLSEREQLHEKLLPIKLPDNIFLELDKVSTEL